MKTLEVTTETEKTLDAIKMTHLAMIAQHQGKGVLFIKRDRDWENIENDKYVREYFNVYPVNLSRWHKNNISDRNYQERITDIIKLLNLSGKPEKEVGHPDYITPKDDSKPIIFLTGRGFERPELEEELQQYLYN